jgi:hypothetical protein
MTKNKFLVLCLTLLVVVMLCGCERRGVYKPVQTEGPIVQYEKGKDFVGVLKSIDTASGIITFYNTGFDQNVVLTYTGGTDFLTKNGDAQSADQLEKGEVFDVYTDINNGKLVKAQVSSDTFTYSGMKGVQVDTSGMYLEAGGSKYQYDKGVVVVSGQHDIDIMEVNNIDQVTLRGKDGKIFSVTVTKGHGYIRPSNYKDFIGGTVIVNGAVMLPVSDHMLIPVPEGSYDVTMKNGDCVGTTSVMVERDQEVDLNMAHATIKPVNHGQVVFSVTPEGAQVYVNGTRVDTSKPVRLKYGQHSIYVVLEGYTSYEGVLDVQSKNPRVNINLAKETVDVTGDKSTVTKDDSNTTKNVTYDASHKIIVSTPVGAEVYANGTYKGIAPCSFTKMIGSISITLSKNGYKTKGYSVDITNDGKDITWNFSDLVKEG